MEFLKKLSAFVVSIAGFLPKCAKSVRQRPQPPPPSSNDSGTMLPESPSSAINLEASQPPRQPSAPPSINDPETLQSFKPLPPPLASSNNIDLLHPPSPTNNQSESSQQQSQPPTPTPTTPSNLKQLESILAAQQHLQWKNSVLSFCLSYALAISPRYAQTDHHHQAANQPNFSFVLLSFLVLVTFNLILVALFISPSSTKTSEVLEKVAFLVAAAAFCLAAAIPFPFELKYAVLAAFLLSLLLITIFKYLNCNIAGGLRSNQPILP